MKNKPKILVVDDEPINVKLLKANLLSQECEVLTASGGEEALKIIFSNQIDLILLDVMMPDINGFEVTKRLKADENTRGIPIILVTSLRDTEDRIKGIESGCDDFLSKPVDKSELVARVQSLLKVKAYYDYMRDYEKKLEAEVSRRTQELQLALKKIEEASLETIYRLSKAAEYKDEGTAVHIQRMSHYAVTVARRLHLSQNTITAILYAAPMHDIGKIGVPDHILLKPGKLDPDEWKIMKQHTIIGGKILEGSKRGFIKLGEIIALTHHEKWDGSGYPKGLKGKQIPLVARIVAIADVFDALTSKRPYREPLTVEEAFNIIKEGKGTHFDPQVVDVFFESEQEILSIKERFSDTDESLLLKMVRGEEFSF